MTDPERQKVAEIVLAEAALINDATTVEGLKKWRMARAHEWSVRALTHLEMARHLAHTRKGTWNDPVASLKYTPNLYATTEKGTSLRKEIMDLERHALLIEERVLQLLAPELREVVLTTPRRTTVVPTPEGIDPATAALLARRRARQEAKKAAQAEIVTDVSDIEGAIEAQTS